MTQEHPNVTLLKKFNPADVAGTADVFADDFVWHYNEVILNDELTPSKPFFIRLGKEVGKIEKVDAGFE